MKISITTVRNKGQFTFPKYHLKLDKLQGVVFDIDGILVDTEYLQWQGWVKVLKAYGKVFSKQEYYRYAGKRGDVIESELLEDFNLNIKEKMLLLKKEEILIHWFKSKDLHLMPFAREAVMFFIERQIKVGCASGSPRKEALLKLKKVGLASLLHNIVSGTDVKRGKPFPDIYTHAVNSLRLRPESCLAFEDTQYGVTSAKLAGLFCFAIPNEFSQKQDFSHADGVFISLQDAIAWIKEQGSKR
jgi:HAD superfamily hydrolase (TIGR01509 family)